MNFNPEESHISMNKAFDLSTLTEELVQGTDALETRILFLLRRTQAICDALQIRNEVTESQEDTDSQSKPS